MADGKVIYTKIKAFLYFYGKDFDPVMVPVSTINLNFGLNGPLPSAVFVVPVGANVTNYSDKSTYSTVHDIQEKLTASTRIDCYISLEGTQADGTEWPEGYHLVWHGYFSAEGFSKQQGQLNVAINSVHWMKDLDTGSMVSKSIVKGSFADLLASSQYNLSDKQTAGIDYSTYQFLAINASSQVKDYEAVDIWNTILLPILIGIIQPTNGTTSKTELFYNDLANADLKTCNNTTASQKVLDNLGAPLGNEIAARALLCLADDADVEDAATQAIDGNWAPITTSHFPITDPDSLGNIDPFIYGFNNSAEITTRSLGLSAFLNYVEAYSSVAYDVATRCSSNVGSYSVFDKIHTVINQYTLSLVINARSATLAPAIPVFNDSAIWRVLGPNDYTGISMNYAYPESLSGVGLFNATRAPDSQSTSDVTVAQGLNSFFIASDVGRMMFITAPLWLSNKGISARVLNNTEPSSNYTNPILATSRIFTEDLNTTLKLAGCALARSVWCMENFKHRTLQISTPLRFDIAPGSCLAIDGINLDAFNNKPDDYKRAYGFVQSVNITIDVNQPSASTTYTLSHVRNKGSESFEADLIPDSHPMFTDSSSKWSGTPLVVINPEIDLVPVNT